MFNDKAVEVVEERFQSLLSRYQTGLKHKMKISDFIFHINTKDFIKHYLLFIQTLNV